MAGDVDSLEVTLRDGRNVTVRPITPDDAGRLVSFHSTLSDRTIYQRFFAAHPRLSDAEVHRFTTVDHVLREAYVATSADEIVAVGRWDAIDQEQAEVAFVITDAYQRQGIGSVLFSLLAQAARGHGITHFVAEVLPQNRAMIRLFEDFGETISRESEAGALFITVQLPDLAAGHLSVSD